MNDGLDLTAVCDFETPLPMPAGMFADDFAPFAADVSPAVAAAGSRRG